MKRQNIVIRESLRRLIPPLSSHEYAELEQSLKREGCRDALVLWRHHGKSILLDGHNRYGICKKHSIAFKVVEKSFASESEAMSWMIRNQMARRNINAYQRAVLALKLKPVISEKAKEKQRASGGAVVQKSGKPPVKTDKELAQAAGVSHDTINKVAVIELKADEKTKERLRRGDVTINKVYSDIRREEQRKEHEAKVRMAKRESVVAPKTLPTIILADPPWRYTFSKSENRRVENHYATATITEIIRHKPRTAKNAVLFLWATSPKLWEAFEVIKRWGFEYVSHGVWDKLKIGMGYWFRGQHEILLIGKKGKPSCPPESERLPSIFREPRGRHSQKPECVYRWIEQAFPDAVKLEMYARKARHGWRTWGAEA